MIKYVIVIIIGILFLVTLSAILFITFSPQFGGKISSDQKKAFAHSKNHNNGKFVNLVKVRFNISTREFFKLMIQYLKSHSNTTPKKEITPQIVNPSELTRSKSDKSRLLWFGHSAFLLQMGQLNVLLDPMLGPVAAPHPWLGVKRFSKTLPLKVEDLPHIDAVIISHDHYDHLDCDSIKKLDPKVERFYVPLGVGVHLKAWGVKADKITEMDWWDEVRHEDVTFVFTPSQHFSGRGLTDRFSTLWGSWVVQSATESLYFSGDGGYGPHFKTIGDKYGPFDFAMMECGQYNRLWSKIHMFPEETVQASIDLKAELMMPIHWGAFKLSLHAWTDPIERVKKKAAELNVALAHPKIGEWLVLGEPQSYEKWWLEY